MADDDERCGTSELLLASAKLTVKVGGRLIQMEKDVVNTAAALYTQFIEEERQLPQHDYVLQYYGSLPELPKSETRVSFAHDAGVQSNCLVTNDRNSRSDFAQQLP